MTNLSEKLEQLSAAAKAISYKLGPFKFNLKRQDNYSGEHREWNEELTLPAGAALTEQIILEALRTGQLVAVQADDATVDRVKKVLWSRLDTHKEHEVRELAELAIAAMKETPPHEPSS